MSDSVALSRVVRVPADNTTGPLRHFKKSADDDLHYCFDWSGWLVACGNNDTIGTSAWTIPAGLTSSADSAGAAVTGEAVTEVYIAGGTAGESYTIENEIVTVGGQTVKATILITIVDE